MAFFMGGCSAQARGTKNHGFRCAVCVVSDYDRRMDNIMLEWTQRIRAAANDRTPLRIRGGASKDFHGMSLHGDVLDTGAYTGVLSYEPSELVITVRAGTPLVEVDALLAQHGQYLPFDPPQYEYAYRPQHAPVLRAVEPAPAQPSTTIGGMVAAGWSGPARANVGAVRDYVLGATLINGQAQHLSFGGQVIKNVAGYDVSRLMVGAWGTLGVLTQVSLKVLPLPLADATLRCECDQATALRQLRRWCALPLPLHASRWVPEPGAAGGGVLSVRLRGAAAAVSVASAAMLRDLPGQVAPADTAQAEWQACRDHMLAWFVQGRQVDASAGLALWRLSLPPTAPVLLLPQGVGSPLVEWHGALRWVYAPVTAGAALRDVVRQVGGSVSMLVANPAMPSVGGGGFGVRDEVLERLHQRIKDSFDPSGIFNPGRMAVHW